MVIFFAITSIYNSAWVVCKQVVVLPVFLCRAQWTENSQTPIDKQRNELQANWRAVTNI